MTVSNEQMPERLATIKEACAYAKMGRTKLYEKMNAEEILAKTRDGRTFVKLDSIDAMNAREMKPWKPGKKMPPKKPRKAKPPMV